MPLALFCFKVIEGLDACNKMTILHLYSNYISQITHISHLQYLEVLGLANNTIVNIEVCILIVYTPVKTCP